MIAIENSLSFIATICFNADMNGSSKWRCREIVAREIIEPALDIVSKWAPNADCASNVAIMELNDNEPMYLGEEFVMARRLMLVYCEFKDRELGYISHILYTVLTVARDLLDECEASNEVVDLKKAVMFSIAKIRSEHPEYMYDPRCSGDCVSCPHFIDE